jgi:hypothetical protein
MHADPRLYLPFDEDAFAALRRRFGAPIAVPEPSAAFEPAGIGEYVVDDAPVHAQVYVFDHARNAIGAPWFWPTVRTTRLGSGETTVSVLRQHLGEFAADVLREDRIDEETMTRVAREVDDLLASTPTRAAVISIDGRAIPATTIAFREWRCAAALVSPDITVTRMGPVDFDNALVLR